MAASYACATFQGMKTGRIYYKDAYLDDGAGNKVRWDNGSGAGAATDTYVKFSENVVLTDLCIVAATAQTKTQLISNGSPTGDIIRNSIHLSTITFRPRLATPFIAGSEIGAIQLA